MRNPFNIGDRVLRIRDNTLGLRVGDIREVSGVGCTSVQLAHAHPNDSWQANFRFDAGKFELADTPRSAQVPPRLPSGVTTPMPPTAPPASTARKDDSGKLDMTLLDDMPLALKAVVEVMQWAVTKKLPVPYTRGSWQGVHADRYRAAIARHNRDACEQAVGSLPVRFHKDAETDLLHLAHIACSALMALENTIREMKGQ